MTASDAKWREARGENGWSLEPAAWPWRLPVIRWFRFAFYSWRVHNHAHAWASVGVGIGGPNQYDRWWLYAIYRGWA